MNLSSLICYEVSASPLGPKYKVSLFPLVQGLPLKFGYLQSGQCTLCMVNAWMMLVRMCLYDDHMVNVSLYSTKAL